MLSWFQAPLLSEKRFRQTSRLQRHSTVSASLYAPGHDGEDARKAMGAAAAAWRPRDGYDNAVVSCPNEMRCG